MLSRVLILFIFLAAPALAQEITTDADLPFVIENSNNPSAQKQKVSDTYREMNSSVTESLQEIPAITVQQSSNQNQFIYLQGGGAGLTGVYLDGLLWNDPSSPDQMADLFGLSSFNIDSVSVLPGPQSGSWGNESLSGIVSFKSRPIKTNSNRFSLRGGGRGFFHLGLNTTQANSKSGTMLNFETRTSAGYSAASEKLGNSEADGFDTQTLFIKHQNHYRKLRIDAQAMILQGEQDFDERGGVGGDDPTYTVEKQNYTVGGTATLPVTPRWQAQTKLQLASILRDYKDPKDSPSDFLLEEKYVGDRIFGQFSIRRRGDESDSGFGVDTKRERMESKGFSKQRVTTGYFIERKDGAIRIESSSDDDMGGASVRGNPEYKIGDLPLYGLIGGSWAMRSPSMGQLYDPQYGNRELMKEYVIYQQIGLRWVASSNVQLRWSWFQSDYHNLVQWDFITSKLNNVGDARISGNEVLTSMSFDRTRVELGATIFNEMIDLGKETSLLRRPKSKGSLGVETPISEEWSVSTQAQFVSERADVDATTFKDVTLPEYWLLDASLKWAFDSSAYTYLQFKNVLDEEYETASGYGSEPFSVFVGTQIQL